MRAVNTDRTAGSALREVIILDSAPSLIFRRYVVSLSLGGRLVIAPCRKGGAGLRVAAREAVAEVLREDVMLGDRTCVVAKMLFCLL